MFDFILCDKDEGSGNIFFSFPCFCLRGQFFHTNDSLLSIQKMTGGGSPAGGRHCSTREAPFCTVKASFLSFDHKGDPVSWMKISKSAIQHFIQLHWNEGQHNEKPYWTAG